MQTKTIPDELIVTNKIVLSLQHKMALVEHMH